MRKYFKRVYRVTFIYYKIAGFLSPLIRLIEKQWKAPKATFNPPVFIVGVPRSGSTYTYQLITSVFPVNYIDNLIDVFHRNIRFAFKLDRWIYKDKRHNVYKSDFGNTMNYSWHAPSECALFWYQYFPKSEFYISSNNIDDIDIVSFATDIKWISSSFKAPLIFKNLMVSGRIYALKEACPEAKFIYIKRDPFYNAQSIIKARRSLGIADEDWWSTKPFNYEELKSLPLIEKIAKQVFYIQAQIERDLQKYYPNQFEIVHYEDYNKGIEKNLKKFSKLLGVNNIKKNLNFSKVDRVNLSDNEAELLKQEIEKLPWHE